MKENLLTLASKLILASTTGDDAELQRVSEDLAAELTGAKKEVDETSLKEITGFLKFNDMEISKMPKSFRHTFIAEGKVICYRKRKRGKLYAAFTYEARYRRHGYNISVSASSLEELSKRFIETLHAKENGITSPKVPTTFHEFATYYFEKYRIRLVKPSTFKGDMNRYGNHLQPRFQSMPLKAFNSDMLQDFVDEYADKGELKNAKELRSLLSCIFRNAVDHGIIPLNPCRLVIVENYESEHGVALTIEEENRLIESLKNDPKYLIPIAVALYAGLRPCEYRTATIEGDFIKAENRKQHSKKVCYKRIPIVARLREILNGATEVYFPNKKYLRAKLIAACPGHVLYDLRTTFDTRCEQYHVADIARGFWMGHGLTKLRKTYADLPDSFFIEEAKKLDY